MKNKLSYFLRFTFISIVQIYILFFKIQKKIIYLLKSYMNHEITVYKESHRSRVHTAVSPIFPEKLLSPPCKRLPASRS